MRVAKDDDILSDAREAFRLTQEHEAENRDNARDDLDFAWLEHQWPEQIRKGRELEGRPCLTINKLKSVIRQVVNDARQNKPAISVHPVDSDADPETAEILSGLIRQIEQSSNAEVAYDTALEFAVSCGFGYLKVNTRYAHDDGFDQDICIERVANPFSIYGDPDSTAADSSDWNSAFELDTLSLKAFEARYKDADPTSFDSEGEDRSKGLSEQAVTIASWWRREEQPRTIVLLNNGEILDEDVYAGNKAAFDGLGLAVAGSRVITGHAVRQYVLSGGSVLETVEWAGKYIPIIPVYGSEFNVEGRRYFEGLVRSSKDAQRMFNYWRSTSTELVALAPKAPFVGKKGAFETDAAKWATANTQTHAYIEYDGPEPPQRQPFSGVPAGVLQESINAADDIRQITGLHEASLGAPSNETSGRAIMARQREGDVGSFHYIDNLSRAIRHCGRIIVDLIPHVYSVPRVIRTLGPQGELSSVVVSPKDMQGDLPPQVQEALVRQQAEAQKAEQEREQASDVARIYDLTAGKYDVTVKVGPSFTSQREEAATQMIELIRAYPDAAPILGDLLVQNMDWPGADKVSERLAKILPPQISGKGNPEADQIKAEAQQVIQQVMAKMQDQEKMIADFQARLQQAQADKEIEARKLELDGFKAETDRMKVVNDQENARNKILLDASKAANDAMMANAESEEPDDAA